MLITKMFGLHFRSAEHVRSMTPRGPRGVTPILFTEAWRGSAQSLSVSKGRGLLTMKFPGQIGCTSSLNHKVAACPGCPLYTAPPNPTPSPRSNNYCFIISSASHSPCSQVSLTASLPRKCVPLDMKVMVPSALPTPIKSIRVQSQSAGSVRCSLVSIYITIDHMYK